MIEANFDRFYVDDEDFERYLELEKDDSFPLAKNHPQIFLLSACIGYKYDLRKELTKPKQLTQKTSVLNLEHGPIIYDAFKLIAYKKGEVDNDGCVIVKTIMEEYAKGGFKILYDEILSAPSSKLDNLVNYMLLNLEFKD